MPKGCQNIIQSSSSPPTPGSEWSASCLLSWGCTFCSKLQFLLLTGAVLVISFVLAENPVVIVIKELDLVKPAIKDKVFNNSYKRTSWCELRFFFFLLSVNVVDGIFTETLISFSHRLSRVRAGSDLKRSAFLVRWMCCKRHKVLMKPALLSLPAQGHPSRSPLIHSKLVREQRIVNEWCSSDWSQWGFCLLRRYNCSQFNYLMTARTLNTTTTATRINRASPVQLFLKKHEENNMIVIL